MWRRRNERQESFLGHLEEVRTPLLAYCRHGLYEPGNLEDVIQMVLATADEKFDDFRVGTNFHAWIFRIATNMVFNANRRDQREAARTVDVDFEELDIVRELQREYAYDELLRDPDRILDQVGDELHSALGELTDKERTVFLLKSICEMPCWQIAEVLHIPIGSVMGYLARARGKLRTALTEYAKDTGFISDTIREESSNGLPND